MGKIKDLYNGEHGTFFKFVTVCCAIFVLMWLVGPGNTVIHWAKSKIELGRQKKQMEYYQQEIEEIRRHVNMIRTDRDTLEKFAREQFYFAAPGEDVYIVEE